MRSPGRGNLLMHGAFQDAFLSGGTRLVVGACPDQQERKCDVLITTTHLLALHELAASEAAGHAVRTLTEDDPQEHIYRELELQGLVLLEVPRAYRLS